MIFRIADALLSNGLHALFAVAMALLKRAEKLLMEGSLDPPAVELDPSQLSHLVRQMFSEITDAHELMLEAAALMRSSEQSSMLNYLSPVDVKGQYAIAVQQAQACYARSIFRLTGPTALLRGRCTEWAQVQLVL